MLLNAEERDRLIGVARGYADGAPVEIRLAIEDTWPNVLVRGVCIDSVGREHIESLTLAWELVQRSGAPEHFLRTQIWAVEHMLTPSGITGRPRP
jgi:hypothetical protein